MIFNESEIDFKFEIPPSLFSLGIKDLTGLTDQLKKINNQFVENKSILINDSMYLYLTIFFTFLIKRNY